MSTEYPLEFKVISQMELIKARRVELETALKEHPERKDNIWSWMPGWLAVSDEEHYRNRDEFEHQHFACDICGEFPNDILFSENSVEGQNSTICFCFDCVKKLNNLIGEGGQK